MAVPPETYGGTERVVAYLTDALVALGHEVTLFASGDSKTRATLVPVRPKAMRLDPSCGDWLADHLVLIDRVAGMAPLFDVIHFHTGFLQFPMSRTLSVPHVTTLHGRLDLPYLLPLFRQFHDVPLVSISNAQRRPVPAAAWQGTVYHGLDPGLLAFSPQRRGLRGVSRPDRPGEAAGSRDRDCPRGWCPPEDRGQGGQDR